MNGLSKSKILNGLQCPKRLYLQVHHPEILEQMDLSGPQFVAGAEVGDIGCLYKAEF
jgi:hypothetical protein